MGKVLSICYPTYNRCKCIKTQIERLMTCPKDILGKIEIVISDNCSTDDTQEIVENSIQNGFQCKYIRNKTNIGMDGNFANCLKIASAKYVWLLGDDDLILIESLAKIVNILDCDEDFGLVHINTDIRDRKSDVVKYENIDEFSKELSFWFTFISSNIPQTKFVKDIDFNKYYGTYFTQVPLFLKSMYEIPKNVIINFPVFEFGLDSKNNGGYNFFQVFVSNYLNIIGEAKKLGYIKQSTYDFMKKDIYKRFVIERINRYLIHKTQNNMKYDNGWKIVHKYYKNEIYYYYFTIPKLIQMNMSIFLDKIKRIVKKYFK